MKPLPIQLSILLAALAAFLPARAQTLGDALNAPELTWTTSGTGGASGWTAQTTTNHDGVSAARTGYLYLSSQTSTLQTTVTGPGTLTYWWSSPPMGNTLTFYVAGTRLGLIDGDARWQQQTNYIGSGTKTLQWVYSNWGLPSGYGYLDEVSYTPGSTAPLITSQPTGQSQVPGCDATFRVSAGGTPPLAYQWQVNGTNIADATGSAYTVTNVQAANLNGYRVIVTNSSGSITSSYASLEFGQITGWGYSAFGDTAAPIGATNVLAITAAGDFGLALNADGTLQGWGINLLGQATIPDGLTNVIAITAGGEQALALTQDGTVTGWGDNFYGQTTVPTGLTNVVAIAAGMGHSLALKANGTVVAWGNNSSGQTNVPTGLTNVVAIAGGTLDSLALKADGTLVMWGSGPALPEGITNATAIAAGAMHDLALLADGTVLAWGDNGFHQLNVPPGLTNVVAISAGDLHSLALLANGTVVAWEYNGSGVTNVPNGLTNVVAIAAGNRHNLALVGDGPPVQTAPLSNPTLSSDGFSVSVPTQSGRVYALEYKTSLADAAWSRLPLVAGNGTNVILRDLSATSGQRFYRVRRW